jgi:TRAP transporter TAXI family solute receptor
MRKSHLKLLGLLISLVLILTLIGCTGEETPVGEDEEEETITSMGIGTASVGGALYALGGGFVNVWNSLGVAASAEVTGGSVHNTNLIQAGEIGSALISQGAAYQGWEGIGLFEGQEPAKKLRTALPLHASFIHGWTNDDSINSYGDFGGKIVCGGPAGGTSDEYSKEILEILDVPVKSFVNTAFADSPNMLRDGMVDVFVSSMGVPASATAECASTLGSRIIGVSPEEAEKVLAEVPFYAIMSIPANTYAGQTEPVETLADVNAYFFSVDIPEDVVYNFVKASYEQIDDLEQSFAGVKDMTLENVKNLRLPLHKGAYKYYQEMGVEIPEAAMPID